MSFQVIHTPDHCVVGWQFSTDLHSSRYGLWNLKGSLMLPILISFIPVLMENTLRESEKIFEWKNIQINFQTVFQQGRLKLLNMQIALLKEEWCLFQESVLITGKCFNREIKMFHNGGEQTKMENYPQFCNISQIDVSRSIHKQWLILLGVVLAYVEYFIRHQATRIFLRVYCGP